MNFSVQVNHLDM